jgi:hypothetical protein
MKIPSISGSLPISQLAKRARVLHQQPYSVGISSWSLWRPCQAVWTLLAFCWICLFIRLFDSATPQFNYNPSPPPPWNSRPTVHLTSRTETSSHYQDCRLWAPASWTVSWRCLARRRHVTQRKNCLDLLPVYSRPQWWYPSRQFRVQARFLWQWGHIFFSPTPRMIASYWSEHSRRS